MAWTDTNWTQADTISFFFCFPLSVLKPKLYNIRQDIAIVKSVPRSPPTPPMENLKCERAFFFLYFFHHGTVGRWVTVYWERESIGSHDMRAFNPTHTFWIQSLYDEEMPCHAMWCDVMLCSNANGNHIGNRQ